MGDLGWGWELLAVCAVVAGVLGAGLPALIARLPEPETETEPWADPESDLEAGSSTVETYAALAARTWLRPLLVAFSAALAAALAWQLHHRGDAIALLWWTPLIPAGLALAVIDARRRLLPTRLVIPVTLLVVVLGCVGGLVSGEIDALVRALIGLAVTFGVFFAFWFVWPSGMGYGDVRLSGLLGFVLGWFGWAELLVGLYLGALLLGLAAVLRALWRRDRSALRTHLPFGPYLLLGAWLAPFLTPLLTP